MITQIIISKHAPMTAKNYELILLCFPLCLPCIPILSMLFLLLLLIDYGKWVCTKGHWRDVQDGCLAMHVPMNNQEHCSHKLLLTLHGVLMHLELKSSILTLLLIPLALLFSFCLFLFLSQALTNILLVIYHQHDLAKAWFVIITTTVLPIPTMSDRSGTSTDWSSCWFLRQY